MFRSPTLSEEASHAIAGQIGQFPSERDGANFIGVGERALAEAFQVWRLQEVDGVGRGTRVEELAEDSGVLHHQIKLNAQARQFARSTRGAAPQVLAVVTSAFSEGIERAIAVADDQAPGGEDGVAHILEVGSLGLMALWLRGPENDYFVPIQTEEQSWGLMSDAEFGEWIRATPTRMPTR